MKKLLFIIATLLFTITIAKSQYQYSSQIAINVKGGINAQCRPTLSISADNVFGNTMSSLSSGFMFDQIPASIMNEANIYPTRYMAFSYYQYSFDNLIMSKWFHLNVGVGLNLGYEDVPKSPLPAIQPFAKSSFIYGGGVRITPEFKVSPMIGLTLEPMYYYLFNSLQKSNFATTIGVKIYL